MEPQFHVLVQVSAGGYNRTGITILWWWLIVLGNGPNSIAESAHHLMLPTIWSAVDFTPCTTIRRKRLAPGRFLPVLLTRSSLFSHFVLDGGR